MTSITSTMSVLVIVEPRFRPTLAALHAAEGAWLLPALGPAGVVV